MSITKQRKKERSYLENFGHAAANSPPSLRRRPRSSPRCRPPLSPSPSCLSEITLEFSLPLLPPPYLKSPKSPPSAKRRPLIEWERGRLKLGPGLSFRVYRLGIIGICIPDPPGPLRPPFQRPRIIAQWSLPLKPVFSTNLFI